jgi:hypothetical protein
MSVQDFSNFIYVWLTTLIRKRMKLRMQFLVLSLVKLSKVINIYDINFVCYKNKFHDESNYTYLVIIMIKLRWFGLVLC